MDATILVTGATGRVGGQVAAQLAGSGARVRAMARHPGGVAGDVVGDLPAETLGPALAGVDAAFLVFPSVAGDPAAAALVEALTAAVPHVVYLSAYGVPDVPDPRAAADGTILGSHAYVEGLLAAAPGRARSCARAGSPPTRWGGRRRSGRATCCAGSTPTPAAALVHEADLAAVAVRCLLGDVPAGGRHHVTGPEQLSQVEQLAAIGAALGRPLRFEALPLRRRCGS